MVRAGRVGALRAAAGLLALGVFGWTLGWGATAHAGAGVAGAYEALGGLRGPLEAQGWSLATDRSSAISPGDIYDPQDHQVQVYGKACFALDTVRNGVAPSIEVDRALQANGKVRFGFWGVGASGHANIDARITKAHVAEVAVADLEPSDDCARQLQDLARAGANVASWVVVQSTLTTDLDIDVCGGGEVSVSADPAGKLGVGADSCRKTQGTSVVLAVRPEPLHTILAAAKVPLPSTGLPVPAPKKKRKDKEPPCWLTAPCLPYVEPVFTVAVGRGMTVGAADNAARELLLGPYERHRQALRELGLGDPPEPLAADAVAVAARHQDDQGYYSLLVVDRGALHARLDAQATVARAALDAPVPEDPVAQAQALARALPIARQLGWWEAELAVLKGDPAPVTSPYADRVEQHKAAIAAVGVRPPEGPASGAVSTALERAGMRVVAKTAKDPKEAKGAKGPTERADLVLGLALEPAESRPVQGFTSVTRSGVLELRAGEKLLGSVDVEASASSQDPKRATADAESALNDRVAEQSVALVEEALGLRAPDPGSTASAPRAGSAGSAAGAQP